MLAIPRQIRLPGTGAVLAGFGYTHADQAPWHRDTDGLAMQTKLSTGVVLYSCRPSSLALGGSAGFNADLAPWQRGSDSLAIFTWGCQAAGSIGAVLVLARLLQTKLLGTGVVPGLYIPMQTMITGTGAGLVLGRTEQYSLQH